MSMDGSFLEKARIGVFQGAWRRGCDGDTDVYTLSEDLQGVSTLAIGLEWTSGGKVKMNGKCWELRMKSTRDDSIRCLGLRDEGGTVDMMVLDTEQVILDEYLMECFKDRLRPCCQWLSKNSGLAVRGELWSVCII